MYVDVTDYFPVNLELTFRGEPVQETLADFVVTIRRRDDVEEPVEEFYLNVVPIENAIILTPRITVRILECKLCMLFIHYTHEQSYHLVSIYLSLLTLEIASLPLRMLEKMF